MGDDDFSGTYYSEFNKEAVHAIILGNVHVEVVSFTINDEVFEMSYPLKTKRDPEEFISLRNHHFNIDQRITVKDMYGSSHSYNLKDIVKDKFIKNEERYVPFTKDQQINRYLEFAGFKVTAYDTNYSAFLSKSKYVLDYLEKHNIHFAISNFTSSKMFKFSVVTENEDHKCFLDSFGSTSIYQNVSDLPDSIKSPKYLKFVLFSNIPTIKSISQKV